MAMETTIKRGLIYLLPLNNKGISAEGLLLHLYRPRGAVPVEAEIMAGGARVGGRGSYRGHLGSNLRSELYFAGRTGTTAESGVREGGLDTAPSLPTRTDREIRVGGA